MKPLSLLLLLTLPILTYSQNSCADALPVEPNVIYTVESMDGDQGFFFCPGLLFNIDSSAEWYSYTPTENVALTITTDLPGSQDGDTRLQVFSGSCMAPQCAASDDDSGTGLLAEVTFNAYAGTTYLIKFDNFWSDDSFDFQLSESEPIEYEISFQIEPVDVTGSSLAAVDMNGDYLDDLVSVTSTNVRLHLQQEEGGFVVQDITTPNADFTPDWSLAAGDLDGNGYNDLLYGGWDGVTIMMASSDGQGFEEISFSEYVFSQRSNMVDINNDGLLDAFVCHDVSPNVFFINQGDGSFQFNSGGLGDTFDGGNYGSIWGDVDNDCDVDMFIAKCRGGDSPANINQLHLNNGDGSFTESAGSANLADAVQTWSAAWGDFDNDGDMDILVGASSFTQGGHKLMINDGTGVFSDQTEGSGFDEFNGLSIEYKSGDFNNDGFIDVICGNGAIMKNNGDLTFSLIETQAPSAAVGDLNNDGKLDVFSQGTVYFNNSENENNYVWFNTIGTSSNKNGIGARVKVTTASGIQIRDVQSGTGFQFMSSLNTHFGLGEDELIESVEVCWPSGTIDLWEDLEVNTTHQLLEGASPVGIYESNKSSIVLYPNPAMNTLFIDGAEIKTGLNYTIYDIRGSIVDSASLKNNSIDLSELKSGVYILEIDGVQPIREKFTKL